ncbi:hypothetical protein U5640_01165 [Streptomyces sp. SS7]|uniref:hypothetical protein n=1 Tax=Streptomyces sp. SS7 TaxID=3108485 RepID=UPI0030EBD48F
MTDGPYPRLSDAFPALAAEIAELLRAEGEPLAEVVADPSVPSRSRWIIEEPDGRT